MKKTKELKKQKNKGITLIALSVTIIILLILAAISITALTGENGLLKQTLGGKDSKEISEEKEIIEISVIQAIDKDVLGNITKHLFQESLDSNVGVGKTTVLDNGDKLVVKFIENKRHYEVDKDGKIDGPKELINDKNAGDITKGNTTDGSEEKPFEINCIEDLVTFSIMVNGGNSELGIESNSFEGKHVILMRTLDFKSIFSYNDYTTKYFGDINTDGVIEDIRTELTKTDDGCIGFTPIGNYYNNVFFRGIFNGRNHEICNLYASSEDSEDEDVGLFGCISGATIKNLGMYNVTLQTNNFAGGICGKQLNSNIINCYIKGNLQFINCKYSAGLIGYSATGIIENCYSTGNVQFENVKLFGGIVGRTEHATPCHIKRCYNNMDIYNKGEEGMTLGGIVGGNAWGVLIEECYHIGDITNPTNKGTSAGIVGGGSDVYESIIKNCYSIGNITGRIAGGIFGVGTVDSFNCYSIGKITRSYEGGVINGMNYGGHIAHCFGRRGDFNTLPEGELTEVELISYLSEYNNIEYGHLDKAVIGYECDVLYENEMKTQEFVDELNVLITAGASGENEGVITEESQNVWKIDSNNINNGYPIFQWQK